MKKIAVEHWNRKEHYHFFKAFDEPFFSFVTHVPCQNAYHFAKDNRISFFALYLHCSLVAVNALEAFRYRIVDDEPVVFEAIHASSTIGRNDDTFGFSFIPYRPDFEAFNQGLQAEIETVRNCSGLHFNELMQRADLIHYSSIPWISFTALSHPRIFGNDAGIPKITFGKMFQQQDQLLLPVSVCAHHALMDGLHVGRFFELFENKMADL